jgi:hypothetical protein
VLDSKAGYQSLYDVLLNRSGIEPGAVGSLKGKPGPEGQPPVFGTTRRTIEKSAPAADSSAVSIWREKLEFLLVQDAITVDPDMKFRLKHLINEAREKIRHLQGDTS